MSDLVERLTDRARAEIRYTRGMRCMQRERYLAYCNAFRLARLRGNYDEARTILSDLNLYVREVGHLAEKQHSAYVRLVALRGAGFAAPAAPVLPSQQPAPLSHDMEADPDAV